MEILIFVFFLVVFFLLLTGGYIINHLKNARKAVQQAADKREQRFRDEVGRQRQQYSQRQQQNADSGKASTSEQSYDSASSSRQEQQQEAPQKQKEARRTQMATGETIIDHQHEKRESRKIFDDEDGEYVEFEEA